MVQAFADVGLLGLDPVPALQAGAPAIAWRTAMAQLLGCGTGAGEVEEAVAAKARVTGELKERILRGFKWFGVFSETEHAAQRGTYLDALCAAMEQRMQFGPDERDLVILQHEFGIEWADGSKEKRTSTLIEYGTAGGYSAMSRLVGVPCGVATQMILDGKITATGVVAPLAKELYEPLLKVLEDEEGVAVVDEIH
jgi:saccharopine dehydrogenase (NADP+, L-glutamate forming)